MVLNGDVKKEISEMISGINREDRTLASFADAFKMVSFYPLLMLGSNVIAWLAFYLKAIMEGDNSGQPSSFYYEALQLIMNYGGWLSLGVTSLLSIIFVLMYLTPVLLWLSIPIDIRDNSKILLLIKNGIVKVGGSALIIGSALSFAGVLMGDLRFIKFSIPVVFFISMFAFTIFITLQSIRFGLGPLMGAAKKLISK